MIELRRDILKYLPVTAVFLLAAPFAAQAATGWQQDGNQNWTYVAVSYTHLDVYKRQAVLGLVSCEVDCHAPAVVLPEQ